MTNLLPEPLPAPGAAFIVTVISPSDFHERWTQSRFRLSLEQAAGSRVSFLLKRSITYKGLRYVRVETLPRQFEERFDDERGDDAVVCRFLDRHGNGSEWTLAVISRDVDPGDSETFFPRV